MVRWWDSASTTDTEADTFSRGDREAVDLTVFFLSDCLLAFFSPLLLPPGGPASGVNVSFGRFTSSRRVGPGGIDSFSPDRTGSWLSACFHRIGDFR